MLALHRILPNLTQTRVEERAGTRGSVTRKSKRSLKCVKRLDMMDRYDKATGTREIA
jgi:hypothetical protein